MPRDDQVRVVSPKSFDGWGISLHPGGPKFTITCGWCKHTFRQRVPRVNYPRLLCPSCNALNRMPTVYGG